MRLLLMIIAAGICLTGPAHADGTNAPPMLSLADAQHIALLHHPHVSKAAARLQQQRRGICPHSSVQTASPLLGTDECHVPAATVPDGEGCVGQRASHALWQRRCQKRWWRLLQGSGGPPPADREHRWWRLQGCREGAAREGGCSVAGRWQRESEGAEGEGTVVMPHQNDDVMPGHQRRERL